MKKKPSSERREAGEPQKGRRFSAEQRQHALVLVAAGMKRLEIARVIGTTTESIRRWVQEAKRAEPKPGEGNGLRWATRRLGTHLPPLAPARPSPRCSAARDS